MADITPIAVPPSRLGESPLWHPHEAVLYWCDIAGCTLNRYDPRRDLHDQWRFDSEPGCCAPLLEGGLLLAMRDGLWRFDTASRRRWRLAKPPYDTTQQRFNDGKADPQGRFWAGTIHEPRDSAAAALYRYAGGALERVAAGITTSNGLAWSPDARTMYWADTAAHAVYAFDFDSSAGTLSNRRVFASFAARAPEQPLASYRGRPDGAAVDVEGAYWVAMYEGARLLRFAPDGALLREIELPAQCPTMPCFGGPDLKTLYVTSARDKRSPGELAALPWSGCVLQLRVDVAGLPANFAMLD
jgi:sugar lactone lactonase YvrE